MPAEKPSDYGYLTAAKRLEIKKKWKGSRPRVSLAMLLDEIVAWESYLRSLPKV